MAPAAQSARKPAAPVTGSCRWLKPLALPLGIGRLAITTAGGEPTEYDVGALLDQGRVTGYRLVKDDDEGYDLELHADGSLSCICPDYLFRRAGRDQKGCKHCAALKVALPR